MTNISKIRTLIALILTLFIFISQILICYHRSLINFQDLISCDTLILVDHIVSLISDWLIVVRHFMSWLWQWACWSYVNQFVVLVNRKLFWGCCGCDGFAASAFELGFFWSIERIGVWYHFLLVSALLVLELIIRFYIIMAFVDCEFFIWNAYIVATSNELACKWGLHLLVFAIGIWICWRRLLWFRKFRFPLWT